MTTNNKLILATALAMCVVSFFLGRTSKHCPEIISVVRDTVETYTPITGGAGSPLTVVTYPKNRTYYVHDTVIRTKVVHALKADSSTVAIGRDTDGFISVDTLRFDSLFVAVTDTGDCRGILKRQSTFGGKLKEKTITITKTIEAPLPLFQLNAGLQTSFSGKWKAVDFGPAVGLSLKQKYLLGYSYLLNSQTHSITLQTKIK